MAKLFVDGVIPECPREAVVAVFSLCGEVTDIYIQPSIGFAFVTMADTEGASLAIQELDGQEIGNKTLMVFAEEDADIEKGLLPYGGGLGDDGKPSWSFDGDGIFWMELWYKLRLKRILKFLFILRSYFELKITRKSILCGNGIHL